MRLKLDVDLGQSQIRGILKVNEFQTKERDEVLILFPNQISKVRSNYERYVDSIDYIPENSSLITLDPERDYVNSSNGTTAFVTGLLQKNEHPKTVMVKSNNKDKVDALQSYVAIMTLIVKSLDYLVTSKLVKATNVSDASKEVEFDVSILLPPTQKDRTSEVFKERLIGTHNITSYIPHGKLEIKIPTVRFEQEGIVAFMSMVIKNDSFEPRPKLAEKLKSSNVMLLDIGASTVDTCVIRQGIVLEDSRYTIAIGGNSVDSKVETLLSRLTSRAIIKEELREVVDTGKFIDKLKEYDLVQEVSHEKQTLADDINSSVTSHLNGVNFDVNSTDYIVVLGGNSESSKNIKIPTLGQFIIQTLIEDTCTNAEVVDIHDYDFEDLVIPENKIIGTRRASDNKLVEQTSFDRLINIYGLSLLTNIKEYKAIIKRRKQAESGEVTYKI